MKKAFTLILVILTIYTEIPAATGNLDKIVHLKKSPSEIIIDGKIDDAWSTADSADNFFQLDPYYNEQPTYRTVAKVLTTEKSIYCIMICYQDESKIQRTTGLLDDVGGDLVSIMLDTFNDKKTAYKFAVNAAGVKADCKLMDDARNRDYSWDGIWFAASKIYDWGFVVEMEIPYKSIQYDENLNSWGIDFDRWMPVKSEDLYWCKYERNEGLRVSKFGRMIFQDFNPTIKGLNLELYPVGLTKTEMYKDGKYKTKADIGLDLLYNPSPKIKLLQTVNPDFAQIEADPFTFNISRYETFVDEKRPFFTEGNEIFKASGKQRNTGFYSPLDLFYSRRIGKILPDGNQVPLISGTKAFGRIGDYEYGGFLAYTGKEDYSLNGVNYTEPEALFHSVRVKKNILDNSSVGVLFVGKQSKENYNGVIDVDGAFREPEWQLSYQVARSINNNSGDFAGSAGLISMGKKWMNYIRGRYVGDKFDISQVGFVPWKGTSELTVIQGPLWYYDSGYVKSTTLYGGVSLNYENADLYMDKYLLLGFNQQLRDNWGYEWNFQIGDSRDNNVKYSSYDISLSSWYNISPKWSGNLNGEYSKTYNFRRDYLASYGYASIFISWLASNNLELGTSYNMYNEWKPDGSLEDITFNMRPYVSVTPFNDLRVRIYVDNVFIKSTQHMESLIAGFLFSYNFSPKSWIYLALNEVQDRSPEFNNDGNLLTRRMHTISRAGVFKVKYLYYF